MNMASIGRGGDRHTFYSVMLILTLVSLLYLPVILIDYLRDPLAASVWEDHPVFRAARLFVLSPITISIGVWVLRRTNKNIVGLFLIIWGVTLATFSVSTQIDPALLTLRYILTNSVGWTSLLYLILYFPDGQAFPRILHPWLVLCFIGFVVIGVSSNLAMEYVSLERGIRNPLFVPAIASLTTSPFSPFVSVIVAVVSLSPVIALLISPILRYRQSNLQTRQQLRWLMLSGGSLALLLLVTSASRSVLGQDILRIPIVSSIYNSLAFLLPAVAVGNAILRHRLYDIDVIIRRTLIYSILSAILTLVFFGGVTLAQVLFRTATGQSSDLAIVASTLAIAALVTPLRRRVQNVIDRRFYRRKYDAEKTLAQFSQTLRDEMDLAALEASMIGVVRDTMQPNTISLWTRPFGQIQAKDETR